MNLEGILFFFANNIGRGDEMLSFKNLPDEEKPRERLVMYGAKSLSNEELLMILLKTGTKKKSVKELAIDVLAYSGGIHEFKNMTEKQLEKIDGIGKVKAIELAAVIEFSKRIYAKVSERDIVCFKDPDIVINYFYEYFRECKQEEFVCIYLDNKKNFIKKEKLFVGTINSSIVHPREIFKEAYLLSASFIICIHNHPSGDPTPSMEDIELTKKVYELGILHAIPLVDHIIIGDNKYFSFYQNHYLK